MSGIPNSRRTAFGPVIPNCRTAATVGGDEAGVCIGGVGEAFSRTTDAGVGSDRAAAGAPPYRRRKWPARRAISRRRLAAFAPLFERLRFAEGSAPPAQAYPIFMIIRDRRAATACQPGVSGRSCLTALHDAQRSRAEAARPAPGSEFARSVPAIPTCADPGLIAGRVGGRRANQTP